MDIFLLAFTAPRMIIPSRIAALVAATALVLPVPALAAKPKTKAPPKPVLTCKLKTTSGLGYTIIKSGKGEKPVDASRVSVNYRGLLQVDGKEFDKGEGASFPVTGVIPGFGEGLKLMQAGGKYRLCIPTALAYGEDGAGDDIPPSADLVFEVDLLSFKNPPPKPTVPAEARGCDLTTPSGLSYAIGKAGEGASPKSGDMALVDLTTYDPRSGEILTNEPWEKIPLSRATPQFAEGLALMQVGASYRFCFPASEAPEGSTVGAIPALSIIVDLIAVRPEPVVAEE
jgi:FKBP-type peptidyl-prolyl cis-trans isomerase